MSKPPVTDAMKFRAIRGFSHSPTPEEAKDEADSVTCKDYDDWVTDSLKGRKDARIRANIDYTDIEHPTARVFRTGIRSIRDGKPSEEFLRLLDRIADQADKGIDALTLVFPKDFPIPIRITQLNSARECLQIAQEFRRFMSKQDPRRISFSEAKKRFKIEAESRALPLTPKKIDRALEQYDLDFPARNPGSPDETA